MSGAHVLEQLSVFVPLRLVITSGILISITGLLAFDTVLYVHSITAAIGANVQKIVSVIPIDFQYPLSTRDTSGSSS